MADPESIPAPQWFSVSGFKSLRNEARVELRPLTVLAGANSSGKSAVMQPLLMLKQTLQSSYDAGPLKLDGPHVHFTEVEQFLSHGEEVFRLGFAPTSYRPLGLFRATAPRVGLRYSKDPSIDRLMDAEGEVWVDGDWVRLREGMSAVEFDATSAAMIGDRKGLELQGASIERVASSLPRFEVVGSESAGVEIDLHDSIGPWVRALLHLPGLRGHRERTYVAARTDAPLNLSGDFLPYVASFIARWQDSDSARLEGLVADLTLLGVTTGVEARRLNATQLQVTVEDPLQSGRAVDIADVGFGVSQALPVVVALRAAIPGQIVYIEQPELHLHPRAQWQMGRLLCAAAERGVRVVIETHSRLILRAIQREVAAANLSPADVGLHWFERDPDDGGTRVRLAELDEDGAFGDWPVDFSEVETQADDAWLDEVYGETG